MSKTLKVSLIEDISSLKIRSIFKYVQIADIKNCHFSCSLSFRLKTGEKWSKAFGVKDCSPFISPHHDSFVIDFRDHQGFGRFDSELLNQYTPWSHIEIYLEKEQTFASHYKKLKEEILTKDPYFKKIQDRYQYGLEKYKDSDNPEFKKDFHLDSFLQELFSILDIHFPQIKNI